MSDSDSLSKVVVGTVLPIAAYHKTKNYLKSPSYGDFFPTLLGIGIAFITVGSVGALVSSLLISVISESSGLDLIFQLLNLLPMLAILILIGAGIFATAITETVEDDSGNTDKSWRDNFPSTKLEIENPKLNGSISYVFGILLFFLSLVFREQTRYLTLTPSFGGEMGILLLYQLFVLMIDFVYIGSVLTSIGQIYIGMKTYDN